MGVSGAGKSVVGRQLAAELGWRFADADDFHPQANVKKMRAGVALTDQDREPWLAALHELVRSSEEPLVLACSALKARYRDVISGDLADVSFVFLRGSFEEIKQRLERREGHYMPASLLQSQFDALEEPVGALTVDCMQPVDQLVAEIIRELGLETQSA